jgi:hypothetical protein
VDASDDGRADRDADHRDVDGALRHAGESGDDAGPDEVDCAADALAVGEAEADQGEADGEDAQPGLIGDPRHVVGRFGERVLWPCHCGEVVFRSEWFTGTVGTSTSNAPAVSTTVRAQLRRAVARSAREDLARLVREGYIDMLSAGNGFAVHDIERDIYGTSLGVNTETLDHARHGHKHHIYAISEVIREGGIEEAVDAGTIESGVMYECVANDVPYVLAGSIRDDGPLPDTITDAVEAQDAIRAQAREADLVLMMSTLLHSVAVGNCLPSTARVVCVDINPATVTQLVDRGSAQAIGMVTDIGTFVPRLADSVLDA